MNVADRRLWLAAVAAFGVGDYATTKLGLASPHIEESNPTAAGLMAVMGQDAGMLAGKTAVLAVCFAGYLYAHRHPETEEYAALFPAVLVLAGLLITGHNVRVLEEAGALGL